MNGFGGNVLKDIVMAFRDFTGGRSDTAEKLLADAQDQVILDLQEQADEAGADALIDLRIETGEMSGGGKSQMFFASAFATPVVLEPDEWSDRNQTRPHPRHASQSDVSTIRRLHKPDVSPVGGETLGTIEGSEHREAVGREVAEWRERQKWIQDVECHPHRGYHRLNRPLARSESIPSGKCRLECF